MEPFPNLLKVSDHNYYWQINPKKISFSISTLRREGWKFMAGFNNLTIKVIDITFETNDTKITGTINGMAPFLL